MTTGAVAACLADTPFETLESWLFDASVSGNGYLIKRRDQRGAVAALEWLPGWRMAVWVGDDGSVAYECLEDGTVCEPAETLPAADVVHLKFRPTGRNRHLGVSPLVTCAPSMGLVTHTRRAGVSVCRNAALQSLILRHPGKLLPEAVTRMKERFVEATKAAKAGSPLVLTEGMTSEVMDLAKAVDLQLVEMSALGVKEVSISTRFRRTYWARLDQSTSQRRVSHNVRSWAVRVGDCLSHSLLTRSERVAGNCIAFDLSAMVRGQGAELADYLSKLANGGIIAPNEARDMLGLGDIDGRDVLRAPVNTLPAQAWASPNVGN